MRCVSLQVQLHPIPKPDGQLLCRLAPVGERHDPLFANVLVRQINQLQQGHVRWESPLGLGHLPHLAVKTLYGIGGIDKPSDLVGILEVRGVATFDWRPFLGRFN